MFSRFLAVGAFCFGLSLLVIWLGTGVFGLHYLVSCVISLLFVNGVGFVLNRRFAFATRARNFWRELGRYYLVSWSSFVVNLALMACFVEILRVPYLLASALVGSILTISNFMLHKFWSFGARPARELPVSEPGSKSLL